MPRERTACGARGGTSPTGMCSRARDRMRGHRWRLPYALWRCASCRCGSCGGRRSFCGCEKVWRVSGGNVGSVAWMQRRLPVFYLVFVLLLTTVMCWVTPPFFGPDEPSQSLRALALLQGDLLPKTGANEAGAEIDTGVLQAVDGMDAIRMRWERQSADFHDRA